MDYFPRKLAFQLCCLVSIIIQHVNMSKLAPSALQIDPPPMIYDDYDVACHNFTYGNYRDMEFFSPAYPGQYPNKINCVMYLKAPPGFVIDLFFKDTFSIEESDGCNFDFIELRDGPFGYSKFLARFCGEGFPVSILTESNYLWAHFHTDDLVQFDGFRAVYEFRKDEDYDPVMGPESVCRIYMDNLGLDGEINSKVFPLADTSRRDYPIDEPIDCTWEMLAERGHQILLSEIKLHMLREEQCSRNRIEMYDRTTSKDDRTGVYCTGPVQDYKSESNRMYLRILGSRLSEKPVLFGRYTVYKPVNTNPKSEPCDEGEFLCDDMCLNQALVCNGHRNCPISGADEQNCGEGGTASQNAEDFPMMIIILAGVGGLLITIVFICICATCIYKKSHRKPKSGLNKQDSQKRNALEMAVNDSTNTAYHLAKQNSQGSYYSLPRPSGHATMMHRGSFSSKVPSEGDYGDHMSDSSTYKKFLQLAEQNLDEDSSRCPSPYSPGFTTIIEQHPMPPGMTMTPDLGWNYQNNPDIPAMPSLAENLSKLQQYTQFSKTIPTTAGVEAPNSGMTIDFRYDPNPTIYPASKFRIKSPEVKYGWNGENQTGETPMKSLTFKNKDADVAPDLTREIEQQAS